MTTRAGWIWGRNGVEVLHLPADAPCADSAALVQWCHRHHPIIPVDVSWDVTDK